MTSPPPPDRLTIEWMTEDMVELYCHISPLVRPILVEVTLFPMEDSINGEA